uniref:Uncharacterized protein n=1 Tax=Alexandrium catenella TaxID=2925 RepID=A0A7S1M8I2_ALECA|mmetsp:Transcript_21793/g.59540  ORF Transcript_21793/g.59540 Transcript_21793/m.59540 type:complete len:764 (+) Transcript_21793:59-2350(+)
MGGCTQSKAADPSPGAGAGVEDRLKFIAKVGLFKRLPKEEYSALANAMESVKIEPGATIIKQGDDGDEFYVIKEGKCNVDVDGTKVATLAVGDYFGEMALLRDEPRTATITASAKVEALSITRKTFDELGLLNKLEFPKRGAVAGGGGAVIETQPPCPKTKDEEKCMMNALKTNQNLQTMGSLDDDKIQQMIKCMWKESIEKGTEVVKQGDLNADYFYIIMEGQFEVMGCEGTNGMEEKAASAMGTLNAGQSFGELALMYFAPRAATVVATTPATLMIIDRMQFKKILETASLAATMEHRKYLDKVVVLDPLTDNEKDSLAKALDERRFSERENIFEQGEKGEHFFILIDGSVKVVKDGSKIAGLTATSSEAQFFGEMALMNNEPRGATVTVTSSSATALVVDKASFDMLLGPLEELKKRGKTGTASVKKVQQQQKMDRFGKIVRKELKRLSLLGCGGFGAVEMVEHTKTSETYALKALSKGYIVKSGMQSSVMSEKNVQLMCHSAFIVNLYETYNGDQSLYFLLELALGGELYATYNKKGLWGNLDCARFYVAGTTFAFEHLHSKKIIFRDLKPENLLLNESGHVKLTDMGLAKVVIGKTYTTCGTPDYFAPELIQSKGHTHAVDWWTLGILTFELLSGHPPFESATPMQIYQKVTKGINRVNFPKKCKGVPETLIKGLCNSNPSERLPMKKGDTGNIKSHAWFQGFDWDAMYNVTMAVPYKPTVKSKKDAGNFSARKEDMPPQVNYKDDKSGWDKDFATSI